MPYTYSTFISYAHAQHELTQTFIENLHKALSESLEPLVRQQVYLDRPRLTPGFRYTPELATAMCASASWVLVFTPRYLEQRFCRRELAAMRALEEHRREQLGRRLPPSRGLIIPIVFRGEEDQIPEDIREALHYLDFRRFTLVDPDISRNQQYADDIGKVATYIAELCSLGDGLSHDCELFTLPGDPEDGDGDGARTLEFPGRRARNGR
jgi:hypothetical protein